MTGLSDSAAWLLHANRRSNYVGLIGFYPITVAASMRSSAMDHIIPDEKGPDERGLSERGLRKSESICSLWVVVDLLAPILMLMGVLMLMGY
jgi:hypothetical protein